MARFTIRAGSPDYALRIVRSTLLGEGHGVSELVEIAALLVSELMANAMVDASDPTLLLDVTERHVYIEVLDSDPTVRSNPLIQDPPASTDVGWRLLMRWLRHGERSVDSSARPFASTPIFDAN